MDNTQLDLGAPLPPMNLTYVNRKTRFAKLLCIFYQGVG